MYGVVGLNNTLTKLIHTLVYLRLAMACCLNMLRPELADDSWLFEASSMATWVRG